MGKIEKLVVLSVLLVIVGILGAAQVWAPEEAVHAADVDPLVEGVTLELVGMPQEAEMDLTTDPNPFVAPGDATPAIGEPEVPEIPESPLGDLITQQGLEASHDPGLMLYQVQAGDTFESIAACYYGEASRAIIVRSENEGLEALVVGTKIWVAVEDDGTLPGRMYTVVEGDNLWDIAHKAYGKGWLHEQIRVANQDALGESNRLSVGMKLRLP
jgi:phage tail protein X